MPARDPSITVGDTGAVHISYYDIDLDSLVYAVYPAVQPNCGKENNWRCATIASAGRFPSISAGDELYIAYYLPGNGALQVAKRVGTGGNCGVESVNPWVATRQCETVGSIGIGRETVDISLVVDISEPVIAYSDVDGDHSKLKLAQRLPRTGLETGNCGGESADWQCDEIASLWGQGGEIDLAVSPSGLANIAYLDFDPYGPENHLRVAYQYIPKFVYLPLVRR